MQVSSPACPKISKVVSVYTGTLSLKEAPFEEATEICHPRLRVTCPKSERSNDYSLKLSLNDANILQRAIPKEF